MTGSPEDFLKRHGTVQHRDPLEIREPYYDDKPGPQSTSGLTATSSSLENPGLIFPSSLDGKDIPEMEWIVDQWIPRRDVTLFYGDGGVGKTLLSQQLMASAALGKPWCTLPVVQCKSMGIFCEDDNDELHRRQEKIQRDLRTDYSDPKIDAMCWWSRKGEDNLLGTFDFERKIQPSKFYVSIVETATKLGVGLIVLDTAADLFSGNENDRGEVRQFIGLLSRMAMAANAAVVLCCHPSRTGMQSGTMDGGSTGWSNSARSRLALERPKADADAEPDSNQRLLTKKKSNRSSIGDFVKLRWQEGVIVSDGIGLGLSVTAERSKAEEVFLLLLKRCTEDGIHVHHLGNSNLFAPKVFSKRPERDGFGAKEFDAAMHRLFAARTIRVEAYKDKNRNPRDRIVTTLEPP